MEDELVETGHPLLALLDYKTNTSKSLPTALSPSGKEAAALQAVVRRVVLSTPSNSKVRMQACIVGRAVGPYSTYALWWMPFQLFVLV